MSIAIYLILKQGSLSQQSTKKGTIKKKKDRSTPICNSTKKHHKQNKKPTTFWKVCIYHVRKG